MSNGRRAVVIEGVRTPFVKAFSEFLKLDAIALGDATVSALLRRTELPRGEIDGIVWGGVILPGLAPNVAREIALDLRLPARVEGHTVTRACASGLQAITSAVAAIERGDADVMIAGGADSTSNAELKLPQKVVHALAPLAFGKATPKDMLGVLSQLMPITEILPKMPKIAERTTGQVMGEAAEEMARRNEVSRQEQDDFAVRSHHRAAAGIASGRLRKEVAAVETPDGRTVTADTLVRADTSVEALAKLRPVFAKDGTLTAGNSSPLTDGAGAVVLASAERAKSLGKPLGWFRAFAVAGVPPEIMGIGPVPAVRKLLAKAGLKASDIDLFELNEAFAAQSLYCVRELGLDPEKVNVNGGAIALGHPLGVSGTRLTITILHELARRNGRYGVVTMCIGGGMGAAALVERA
jgi:acetyl-CoA acyltransferase